jgi:anti-sigma regulatory factor (Ser/Thr protein kinase)
MVSGNIVLRDYIDVAELRIRALALAAACGLSRSHQGFVALAITDAGVFAIQHADRLAVELFIEDEDVGAPFLMVVVRDADVPATEREAVSQPSGHDVGLVLAERASERFSVEGETTTGMTVTMGWALKAPVGWVDPGDHLSHLPESTRSKLRSRACGGRLAKFSFSWRCFAVPKRRSRRRLRYSCS